MTRTLRILGIVAALSCVAAPAMAEQVVESRSGLLGNRQLLLTPTLGVNVGGIWRYQADIVEPRTDTHVSFWGGLSLHAVMSDSATLYLAGGVEVEPFERLNGQEVTYIMPMAQFGTALIGCHDEPSGLAATFPCLKIYGIAGMRPGPRPDRFPSIRLGAGLSSVWLMLIGAQGNALLPSSFEGIFEADPHGNRTYMLRAGFGF